jgi:uncharacterized protein (TIRG00374 family)
MAEARGLRWLSLLAAPVITIAAFAYLLTQVDLGQIGDAVRRLEVGPLLVFLALLMAGVVARALRFWVLLGRTVRLPLLLGIVMVRNLFIDLLPARLGELAYVYLLTRRGGRPPGDGIATVVVAVLLDMIALAPMLVIALAIVGSGGHLSVPVLMVASVGLALGGLAVVLAAPAFVERAERFLAARRERAGTGRWVDKVLRQLGQLATSLRAAGRASALVPAFGLTLIVRFCKFSAYYALVVAILAPMGFSTSVQGTARVFLGVVSAELAAMLPVHGIAGFGSFEAAWAFSFEQLGFPRQQAIISAILGHAISQIVEYVLGGLALVAMVVRVRPGAAKGGALHTQM